MGCREVRATRRRRVLVALAAVALGGSLGCTSGVTGARTRTVPVAATDGAPGSSQPRGVDAAESEGGAAPATAESVALQRVRRFRSARGVEPSPLPSAIRVPGIGIHSPLVSLGRQPDGTVEVPADWHRAGWFRASARPGQPGPAVILGHVDSRAGPAVFFRLHELTRGDLILIDRADGSAVRYQVDRVERHPKSDFPTSAVYFPTLDATLRLVTCGGAFDVDAGSYRDNVVVFATLID